MAHLPIYAAVFSVVQQHQQGPLAEPTQMTAPFYSLKAGGVSVFKGTGGDDALVVCWG
jgi:hypothetical protein